MATIKDIVKTKLFYFIVSLLMINDIYQTKKLGFIPFQSYSVLAGSLIGAILIAGIITFIYLLIYKKYKKE